jgi:hypothetical protein
MKTILVISDNSPTAGHAIKFALAIAQMVQANILIANTFSLRQRTTVKATTGYRVENVFVGLPLFFINELNSTSDFRPEIDEWDISAIDECKVAQIVNKRQIWMIVKGVTDILNAPVPQRNLNIHSILSKVLCPFLLVPESWPVKAIERLTYIADLRYCHTQIVRYLVELAKPWNAYLSIANLTAQGLPEMSEEYAQSLFEEAICNRVNYDYLFINNIRERNIGKVVDVLINGLHNDVLVLVNRQFYFEDIMRRYITNTLPETIKIPILIFPC